MPEFKNIEVKLSIDYDISTSINGSNIEQVVICKELHSEKFQQLSKRVHDTLDEQFRNAMIELGWKPPEE